MKNLESTNSLVLTGNSASLTINVLAYENSGASNFSDANWLKCYVQLESVDCSFGMPIACTTEDVKCFHDEFDALLESLKGEAAFLTDEGAIGVNLKVDSTGGITVKGFLKRVDMPRLEINFEFESDQSEMGKALWKLRDIRRKFPVIESKSG